MRGEDGVQGRPVSGVGLEHLFDQVVQLVRQVPGQRGVRAPTHLQNETLPACCLELDTRTEMRGSVGQQTSTAHLSHEKYAA